MDYANSGRLGISYNQCTFLPKKSYQGNRRGNKTTFDIVIEVKPEGADRPVIVYIVECKSYSGPVPVGAVESFLYKLGDLQDIGKNVKGVFITDSKLQKSARNLAEAEGLMYIEVGTNDQSEIVLHRVKRGLSSGERRLSAWDGLIEDFFTNAFYEASKLVGLKYYSKDRIESLTQELWNELDPGILENCLRPPLEEMLRHLNKKKGLRCLESDDLGYDYNGNKILAEFRPEFDMILWDKSLEGDERKSFVIAHELGHFVLHRKLKANGKLLKRFPDSEYSYSTQKHQLENDKHFLEWQANYFSSCLLMPSKTIKVRAYEYRKRCNIPRPYQIYLDRQPSNIFDYQRTLKYLANYFRLTQTNIEYRLENLGVLIKSEDAFGRNGEFKVYHF